MRVLTVRQPWANAIIHLGKDVENRPRSLGPYTGLVAIHASTQLDKQWADRPSATTLNEAIRLHLETKPTPPHTDTTGAIIGVARLVATHQANSSGATLRERVPYNCCYPDWHPAGEGHGPCSPWAEPGAWHLTLADARPLSYPIPYKGALGLTRIDPDSDLHRTLSKLCPARETSLNHEGYTCCPVCGRHWHTSWTKCPTEVEQ